MMPAIDLDALEAEVLALIERVRNAEVELAAGAAGQPASDDHDLEWCRERLTAAIDRANSLEQDRDARAAQCFDLLARAEAAEREAERLRHGVLIEGDFVCPNELAATNLEGALRGILAADREHGPVAEPEMVAALDVARALLDEMRGAK